MKKALNYTANFIMIVFLLCMVTLVFFSVGSKLAPDGIAKIADYRTMVVLSGSMSPAFEAGDVIVVEGSKAGTSYQKGDIITFKDPEEPKRIVTHRVVLVEKEGQRISYRTKGDANNAADAKAVPSTNVIGKEKLHIPYFGRVVQFSQSRQGLIWLIIVPGFVIILSELRKIGKAVTDEVEKKKREVAG